MGATSDSSKNGIRRAITKVSFTDKYLQHQVGVIAHINQRTASVECETGTAWRVPFAMLSHVMDI